MVEISLFYSASEEIMLEMDEKSVPYTKEYIYRLVDIEDKKAIEAATVSAEADKSEENAQMQRKTE